MEAFAYVVAILTLVVEKLCEFVLQGLVLVGVKTVKPEAKAMAVVILTVVMCFLFNINVFPLVGVTLMFTWLEVALTGLLVGSGADLYHIAKEKVFPPKVAA